VGDEDLAALYRGAVALVYPSQYEGFGLPALEAMACGCPVIATTGGALPEVVGDAGLLVEPGASGPLGEAMRRVSSDGGLREDLIRKGLERARTFSWERTAARMLEIYEGAHERWRRRA
jgi:glycosyltransferase involved in cell wall biosynthesis